MKLTPEFRKQIVRLKKGLPSCSSPMKSPVPHLTTPPRGSAHKPQPQSAPAALKVVDAPGTTAVARLVEIGPLVLRGATARRPGLLARVWACSTHIQRSARAALIARSGCVITVSTPRSLSVRAFRSQVAPHVAEKNAKSGSCVLL